MENNSNLKIAISQAGFSIFAASLALAAASLVLALDGIFCFMPPYIVVGNHPLGDNSLKAANFSGYPASIINIILLFYHWSVRNRFNSAYRPVHKSKVICAVSLVVSVYGLLALLAYLLFRINILPFDLMGCRRGMYWYSAAPPSGNDTLSWIFIQALNHDWRAWIFLATNIGFITFMPLLHNSFKTARISSGHCEYCDYLVPQSAGSCPECGLSRGR